MARTSVYGVVVTYNRKAMLLECLEALADQTHPLEGVVVVDNASSDGTLEALEAAPVLERLPVDYVRVERNGGGAEGFHYGVRAAIDAGKDWIWPMDDDCEPPPDALAALLAAPRASDPGTAVVAPIVTTAQGELLSLNRGWLRRRWFIAPLVGLSQQDHDRDELAVDYASLVGPLVSTAVAARTDPPRREFFIWWDDLEWSARLRRLGGIYVIPASRIVHKDERPLPGGGLRVRLRDLATAPSFEGSWKHAYGLRNLLYCGRREGFFTPLRALAFVAVASIRPMVHGPGRLRSLRILLSYARDGWRGVFLNLPPSRWPELAVQERPREFLRVQALRYDGEAASAPRRLEPTKPGASTR